VFFCEEETELSYFMSLTFMPEKAKLSLFHSHVLRSSCTTHSFRIYIFDSQSLALRFLCNLQASRHFLKDKITTDEMTAEILLENLTVVIFSYGYRR